ncbi:MAG: hypothetical protein ACLPJW_04160 [Rhodomicrobium sp.]
MRPSHRARVLKPAPQMAIAAPVFTAMRDAIAVGDYAFIEEVVAEALLLWCKKRQHELEALSALSREIEAALSAKKLDAKKIAELRAKGRALLGMTSSDQEMRTAKPSTPSLKKSGLFDAVIDFDAATAQKASGALRPEFVLPTNGVSQADHLHPNRAGYLAIAQTADPDSLVKESLSESPLSQRGDSGLSFELPTLNLTLGSPLRPPTGPGYAALDG